MRCLGVSLIFACSAGTAVADFISPLNISNYNPLTAVRGLPQIGEAEILRRGASRARVQYDLSSHYAQDESAGETILLDGETARATLVYQRGLNERLQLGFSVPYLKHDGGSLDSFINNWHDTFGMPEGGRDQAQNNVLRYTYSRDGQVRFDMQDKTSGLGDVQGRAAWQLHRNSSQASALEMSVKLPTGDSETLLGSGALDLAIWYKSESRHNYFGLNGGGFYSLGALYSGNGDVLPEMERHWVGFGGFGGGVYLTDRLLFISQLDINTPFYYSNLVELGNNAAQLTLGGSVLLSERARINLGIAEDLIIDASPDVTFHIDAQWRF